MNTLLLFLFACFMAGIVFRKVSIRNLYLAIAAACVLVAINYYFFGRL